MANDDTFRPTSHATLRYVARLAFGGAISGALAGVYVGALVGVGYAVWTGDFTAALDGAGVGAALLAVIGASYGTFLGLSERWDQHAVQQINPTPQNACITAAPPTTTSPRSSAGLARATRASSAATK
jgi:hypothetical protein